MADYARKIKDAQGNSVFPVSAKSASDYCKLPDGTLIQWGNGSGTTYTHTYTVPFVSKPNVIVSPRGSQHQVNYDANTSTTNILNINISQDSTAYFDWIAIGRWYN